MGSVYGIRWRPNIIAHGFEIYNAIVGHAVMIWAKCYQVGKVIHATFGSGGDVMDVYAVVKTADDTAVTVANFDLLLNVFPSATSPVAVIRAVFWVGCGKAVAVAIGSLRYLAGEARQLPSAMSALCFYLVCSARAGDKPLPSSVALIIATGDAMLRWVNVKSFPAYRAGSLFLAAFVVAVTAPPVLVGVYVIVLLAWIFFFGHDFTAPALAKYNFWSGIVVVSHETIIPC